jgi:hypothetical protein
MHNLLEVIVHFLLCMPVAKIFLSLSLNMSLLFNCRVRLRVGDLIFYLMAAIAMRYIRSAIFVLFIDLQNSNFTLILPDDGPHHGFFPRYKQLYGQLA